MASMKYYQVTMTMVSKCYLKVGAHSRKEALTIAHAAPLEFYDEDLDSTTYRIEVISAPTESDIESAYLRDSVAIKDSE